MKKFDVFLTTQFITNGTIVERYYVVYKPCKEDVEKLYKVGDIHMMGGRIIKVSISESE